MVEAFAGQLEWQVPFPVPERNRSHRVGSSHGCQRQHWLGGVLRLFGSVAPGPMVSRGGNVIDSVQGAVCNPGSVFHMGTSLAPSPYSVPLR